MKPLLIAFTFFCSVFAKSSFAQTSIIKPAILQAFNLSYSKVGNVKWSKTDELYKAEFMFDDQATVIYYNEKGELIATSRYITSYQLPMALNTKLGQEYKNYKVDEIFEVVNQEGSRFYAVLEDAKIILTLESYEDLDWSFYKRKRK